MSTPNCSVSLIDISVRIEEAYYAAKNKEVVKPDAYEATAEASGQRFSEFWLFLTMNLVLITLQASRRSPHAYAAS
jgi:hypothetical protein